MNFHTVVYTVFNNYANFNERSALAILVVRSVRIDGLADPVARGSRHLRARCPGFSEHLAAHIGVSKYRPSGAPSA